ncbi:hypothetical protein H8356DRAFT_1305246 [Neocallimastix lanati (nom. inval.)]|nr:hypothetical protein H8356DRAFT_1305246 [Neocallimastix sp. JGI-2020a]
MLVKEDKMNQFKTYYLIDFENVSIRGLEGSEMLTKNDYVHIFSTKHGALITTATLASLNNTNLQVHEVKSRKQSVDMSIATFIGYLIGKNEKNINFVIISNDHDFDSVREFWKLKKNLIIKRQFNDFFDIYCILIHPIQKKEKIKTRKEENLLSLIKLINEKFKKVDDDIRISDLFLPKKKKKLTSVKLDPVETTKLFSLNQEKFLLVGSISVDLLCIK